MMCYKDRAWCSQSLGDPKTRCANYKCDRNLTPEEREQAVKWWGATFKRDDNGSGPPVMHHDYKNYDCGYIPLNEIREL